MSYSPDRIAFSNSSCFSVPSNAASFLELETLSVSHIIALRKHPKLVVILVGDTWGRNSSQSSVNEDKVHASTHENIWKNDDQVMLIVDLNSSGLVV